MPSDAKKKRDQKKKDAAKNRSNPKPKGTAEASTSAACEVPENLEQQVQNGDILNGVAIKELSIT
uniref:Uncharacterized protein n=1 Tax=Romanomermis culicivorax TaxID=13658 RepID=A0A915IGY7_ROMCU